MACTLEQLTFARAVFTWAARNRHPIGDGVPFSWAMHNFFMRSVMEAEARIIACQGKWSFRTFEAAQQVAQKHSRHDHRKARHAYHCQSCGDYHIGTSQSKGRRALEKLHRRKMEPARA
jgi:hypothetical protein